MAKDDRSPCQAHCPRRFDKLFLAQGENLRAGRNRHADPACDADGKDHHPHAAAKEGDDQDREEQPRERGPRSRSAQDGKVNFAAVVAGQPAQRHADRHGNRHDDDRNRQRRADRTSGGM